MTATLPEGTGFPFFAFTVTVILSWFSLPTVSFEFEKLSVVVVSSAFSVGSWIVAASGVTGFEAPDAALIPAAFVAVTENVNEVPAASPVTTHAVAPVVAQACAPPPEAVTV